MSKLSKALKTNDLSQLAHLLQAAGRGNDTMLAHITPREAALLKRRGGSGTKNPKTGLMEFDDGSLDLTNYTPPPIDTSSYTQPAIQDAASAPISISPSYDYGGGGGGGGGGSSASSAYPVFDLSTSNPYNYGAGQATIPNAPSTASTPALSAAAPSYVPNADATTAAAAPGATPTFGDTLSQGYDKAKAFLENNQGLARLGLAGGLALMGANKAKQGANQIANITGQEQAIAAPYQKQGQALIGSAQRGELSPASAQAYQAAQAQLRQGVESRGGVGAQQMQVQLEQFRQQLLQNQYTYGLSIAQIGDNIALGAIKTGLQLDQQLNQATQAYYTQLAMFAAGGNPAQQKQQGVQ